MSVSKRVLDPEGYGRPPGAPEESEEVRKRYEHSHLRDLERMEREERELGDPTATHD